MAQLPHSKHTQSRPFGRSAVRTTLLGFGAAPIGNLYRAVDEEEAGAAVASALAAGVHYFDTAPHYGFGLSESRLGAALAASEVQPVLSSKVGRVLQPVAGTQQDQLRHGFAQAPALEPVFDYSYDGVMRSFESSQKRLGRERLDIIYAHDLGEVTHGAQHEARWREFIDGGFRAMAQLRDEGLVGALGLGANESQVCSRALDYADFDGFLLAGRYTLLEQGALDNFLPHCDRRGASVVLGGPFNSGILATGVQGEGPHYYNYEPAPAAIIERVQRLENRCRDFQIPLAAAALQFPAAHPRVCSVLAGLADVMQVETAVALFNQAIPAEFWETLREDNLLHPAAPVPKVSMSGVS